FRRLIVDMVENRVSFWFWKFAFAWELGPEVMYYGRELGLTPAGAALQFLWKTVPVGSLVFSVRVGSNVDGCVVGFFTGSSYVVVGFNENINEYNLSLNHFDTDNAR